MKPWGFVLGLAALSAVTLSAATPSPFDKKLAKDKQAVHVLNRLAFGPTSEDLALVRRLGAEKWIRAQLDPDRLPESPELSKKLSPLASLELESWQLFESYRAVTVTAPPQPSPATLIPADQFRKLSSGTPDEKRTVLRALTPELRRQILGSMNVTGVPEFEAEAVQARRERSLVLSAELRRLRPPLTDLLPAADVTKVQRGTNDEKLAILDALAAEKRKQVLVAMPVAAVPDKYRREATAARDPPQMVMTELVEHKLQRARYSSRQLQEVLADFWLNHFNVYSGKGAVRMLLTSFERDAIRPHVLGRFEDMLLATARHPAMLFYLDNWQSQAIRDDVPPPAPNTRRPGLNENYGRELLELHTLGVDGGYGQDDVVAVARAFTGWTIFDPNRIGEFQFNPAVHDRKPKRVLGMTLPAGGGEQEGVKVIAMLARHPSTARFISRKLAQRFVADDPPSSLVDRMAETFTKSGGDLRAVTDVMVTSREFLSEGAFQSKLKSPLEIVVSALRAVDADVTDTMAVAQRIAEMGQPLYGKVEPTGYPNAGQTWASAASLLSRINFASALTAGGIAGVTVDTARFGTSPKDVFAALTGTPASDRTLAAIEKGLEGKAAEPGLLATVVIASPEFQKR